VIIENFRKYGVLLDITPILDWVDPRVGAQVNLMLVLSLGINIAVALVVERLAARYPNAGNLARTVHWANISASFLVPCTAIWILQPATGGAFVVVASVIIACK
jgi:hypothetical protein